MPYGERDGVQDTRLVILGNVMRKSLFAAASLMVCALTTPAFAWGAHGHRLIANLAYERLSHTARVEVDRLIASNAATSIEGCSITSFEDASTWPDCVRNHPEFATTAADHFVDIPLCGSVDRSVYCPDGLCVIDAIKRYTEVLRNRQRPIRERLEALAFVVHFVGDIHQPLHAENNGDKGGNDVHVIYLGQATYTIGDQARPNSLHGIWDGPLVDAALGGGSAGRHQIERLATQHASDWSIGGPDDWAVESHHLAETAYSLLGVPVQCNVAPTEPVNIAQGYVDAVTPIVREQLAKASVRLAALLNSGALASIACIRQIGAYASLASTNISVQRTARLVHGGAHRAS